MFPPDRQPLPPNYVPFPPNAQGYVGFEPLFQGLFSTPEKLEEDAMRSMPPLGAVGPGVLELSPRQANIYVRQLQAGQRPNARLGPFNELLGPTDNPARAGQINKLALAPNGGSTVAGVQVIRTITDGAETFFLGAGGSFQGYYDSYTQRLQALPLEKLALTNPLNFVVERLTPAEQAAYDRAVRQVQGLAAAEGLLTPNKYLPDIFTPNPVLVAVGQTTGAQLATSVDIMRGDYIPKTGGVNYLDTVSGAGGAVPAGIVQVPVVGQQSGANYPQPTQTGATPPVTQRPTPDPVQNDNRGNTRPPGLPDGRFNANPADP